jgi:hypothetical protein
MNTSIGSLSRRTFLRRLSAVPFGLFGIRLPLKVEPAPRQTAVGRYYVAGFQYYRGPELIGRIQPGEAVRLAAEPENPHDPMAVRVDHGGEKLGYIPRRENQAVSRLLREGARIGGRVVEVRPDEDPWKMLVIEALLGWS